MINSMHKIARHEELVFNKDKKEARDKEIDPNMFPFQNLKYLYSDIIILIMNFY